MKERRSLGNLSPPMPTATLIPIDRTSIKKNPRAGQTTYTVPGLKTAVKRVVIDFGNEYRAETFHGVPPVAVAPDRQTLLCDKWISVDFAIGVHPGKSAIDPPIITEVFSVHRGEPQTVHRLIPEPEWLYSYVPTQITCENCGATFAHTELQSDDSDETYIDNLCPKCGSPAADVEYERIGNVKAERNDPR